jgi:hypothetical protein
VLPEACTKLQRFVIWDVLSDKYHTIVCPINKIYIARNVLIQVHSCKRKFYGKFLLSYCAAWKQSYVTNNTSNEIIWIKYDRQRTFMQTFLQWKRGKYCIFCVFVELVDQHAKRLRHIVFAACMAPSHFSTLLTNRTIFVSVKCMFLTFSTIFSETFLIIRRIERDIVISVHRSSCKTPVITVRF